MGLKIGRQDPVVRAGIVLPAKERAICIQFSSKKTYRNEYIQYETLGVVEQ